MDTFESLKQKGFEGDLYSFFKRGVDIGPKRAGWELFLEIKSLSPSEYISAFYSLLGDKRVKEIEEHEEKLRNFYDNVLKTICKNSLDDKTSLKYKLIFLTDSLNIRFLVKQTASYDRNKQRLKELIIDEGYSLADLSSKMTEKPDITSLFAKTLEGEGWSVETRLDEINDWRVEHKEKEVVCPSVLYSEWRNIRDVMWRLVFNEELLLVEIYEQLRISWPLKIDVAMLYYMVSERTNAIIIEIQKFLNDMSFGVDEKYKNWLDQEKIIREKNMEMLNNLLWHQYVLLENCKPLSSTFFIIKSFISTYSLENYDRDGTKIFNRMKISRGIPFIYYRESSKNVYSKIYKGTENLKSVVLSESDTSIPGKIYITIWTGKLAYSTAIYTIRTNELELVIQEIWKAEIQSLLEAAFGSMLIQTNKTKIKGSFSIYSAKFHRASFLDVILNDSIVSKYLYIDESSGLQSSKSTLQIKFTSTMGLSSGYIMHDNTSTEGKKSVLTCNVEPKIVHQGDVYKIVTRDVDIISGKVTTEVVNHESETEKDFIKLTLVNSDNIDVIISFISTMKRIIDRYDTYGLQREYKLLLLPTKTKIPEKYVQEKTSHERKRRQGKSKLQALNKLDPTLFFVGYARKCEVDKQPEHVSEEEAKQLISDGIDVLSFPTVDGNTYYFRGNNEFPFVGVIPNPTEKINIYPYVPCLYATSQTKSIKNWRAGIVLKKKPSQKLIRTDRILTFKSIGVLPLNVDRIISIGQDKAEYRRRGMIRSPSSFLQCVLEVIGGEYSRAKNKLDYVNDLRVKLSQQINPGVMKQELYDLDEKEITSNIENTEIFLDPCLYFRALEELFEVAIYIFTKNGMLIPRFRIHHIKVFKNRNAILIYKNIDQCELIYSESPTKKITTIFSNTHLYQSFLKVHGTYTWSRAPQGLYLRVDLYSSIYFYGHVLQSLATHQYIDSYGKVRGYLTTINDVEVFIAVMPSQPENIITILDSFKPPQPDIKIVLDIFPQFRPTGVNVHGVWYPILDIQYGIFVYASGVSELYKLFGPSEPLGFYESSSSTEDTRHMILNVVLQVIDWIYTIFLLEAPQGTIDMFFNLHVSHGNDKIHPYDISDISYYNILPRNVNIDRAIEFANVAVPGLIKDRRLWMYSKPFDMRIRYHLKETFSMIMQKELPERIIGLWSSFKHEVNTVLIIGDKNLRNWVKDELRDGRNSLIIKDKVNSKSLEPYIYKTYMVQNVDSLDEALAVALHWNRYVVNIRTSDKKVTDVDYAVYNSRDEVIKTNFDESDSYLQVIEYSYERYGAMLPMM
uniref:Early transcription factor large subunit-like protein n=1 Tax=Pithovirus LCPAC403 TaxID=2506596 RepID=A0A481ZAU7_9VIRU|nr:MAG: uncharacterized protein LCPAC403_01780 [Pithovirus LCPAC403]